MRREVDTNILLDLLGGDPAARLTARGTLSASLGGGTLVVCPVVYAELDATFGQSQETERFLSDLGIELEDFTREALRFTSAAWRAYTRRRGPRIQCARCGHHANFLCPACQSPIAWRQHLISDFLIGGHATAQADALITRDVGYYRTYFPRLPLVVPGSG